MPPMHGKASSRCPRWLSKDRAYLPMRGRIAITHLSHPCVLLSVLTIPKPVRLIYLETWGSIMRNLALKAFAACLFIATPALADTFHLDPGHTDVRFFWDHAGVSEQSGRWDKVVGTVDFDKDDKDATKVSVTIESSSINTGVEGLDKHLRSKDFFEVEEHPEISFVSTGVKQISASGLQVEGDLTIKGTTKPITLDVELVHQGEHPLGAFIPYYEGEWMGIKATGSILRSDFGVGMFAPLTSDRIRLVINSEMKAGGF